ncbi:MerR family transcriptional regulator [Maritalea mediterranea]|uniref:MerR family transcriptional regulator n=1 Tax=Maritalea mediterranea TaxID=2909667 RepID=A0ABS9E2V1_9HYPH|nr:MerR family transcriptional regulator [Maritalea mediterranea]MCF4097189.1 MerR family transcriptional regulator [Maritalea mediterranea]
MKTYLIKQVAEMAGITVRALHHYDQIGLLSPAYVGDNGYRYYTRDELLRLQQIMFFREMDMPLKDIQIVMAGTDFDRLQHMKRHREKLAQNVSRQQELLAVIDRSIAELNGDIKMNNQDLYKGFSPEKQRAYQDELVAKHGVEMRDKIVAANRKFSAETQAHAGGEDGLVKERMAQLEKIEGDLILMMQAGKDPADGEVLDLMAHHHQWVGQWWDRMPDAQAYAGLADMYQHTPDFQARYERLAEGFTDFLVNAMRTFAIERL